ncbi:MAG TPA: NAD(P)-dependent oxidoreductase [Capsulimonadaceae bacterium]|jgi:nucleoside-diphosphate-sugar epimerase
MINRGTKTERFFITGGMGYIGSVFAQEALRRGHDVCLYDNLLYEQNRERILREVGQFKEPATQLKCVIGDTRNGELLRRSIEEFQPTFVMHWGDLSSVYACNHNPRLTKDVSYDASCRIVDLCKELGIRLFFNSTSSLYGVQAHNQLMTENDEIPEPTDLYCHYKLAMETYIKSQVDPGRPLDVIVFRAATVLGLSPRFRIELLPNHFTYMGVAHGVIKVANLEAYRAAIDIRRLVEGYFRVIQAGEWKHLIYNIGHYNLSKLDFARGVQEITHCKIEPIPDFGDLRNLQIDSSLFDSEFGFHPTTPYVETIAGVAEWISQRVDSLHKSCFSEMLNMPVAHWLKLCS